MTTMYKNLCGNCVGGVDLTFMTFHMRVIKLRIDLTIIFKIARL
jgi:hypothetical protein